MSKAQLENVSKAQLENVSRAQLENVSKAQLYMCPGHNCICVRGTAVYVSKAQFENESKAQLENESKAQLENEFLFHLYTLGNPIALTKTYYCPFGNPIAPVNSCESC